MKEQDVEPQEEQEKEEVVHYDEIDREHYIEGAGDDLHEPLKPRITLLYLRCCENERGKPLQHVWYDLTGISNDGSNLREEPARHQIYGKKKKGHTTKNIAFAQPGAIYSFEKSEGGVYSDTGQYQGRWKNEEDVLKWTTENNAIDRAAELAATGPKRKTRNTWIGRPWSLFDKPTITGSTTSSNKCFLARSFSSSRSIGSDRQPMKTLEELNGQRKKHHFTLSSNSPNSPALENPSRCTQLTILRTLFHSAINPKLQRFGIGEWPF